MAASHEETKPAVVEKKGVPMWIGLVILLVLAGAFAGYFLMQRP
jgi:hypothetical protein